MRAYTPWPRPGVARGVTLRHPVCADGGLPVFLGIGCGKVREVRRVLADGHDIAYLDPRPPILTLYWSAAYWGPHRSVPRYRNFDSE